MRNPLNVARLLLLIAVIGAGAANVLATTAASDHLGALPVLLSIDRVRDELKLSSLQQAILASQRNEYKAAARKLISRPPATAEERKEAERKLAELNERYNRRALSVLNESQRERLAQIEHQALGATMLYSPRVQREIQVSPTQKQEIENIRRQGLVYLGKINRRFEDGKISVQERVTLLRKRRLSQSEDLLAVLTADQRSALLKLRGSKVTG